VDTVHECDRRTDGQPDRITITKTVQRRASHGKNRIIISILAAKISYLKKCTVFIGPPCIILFHTAVVLSDVECDWETRATSEEKLGNCN